MLTWVYVFNSLARQLRVILQEPIKAERIFHKDSAAMA